uniref:Uncharacterized protein n=1 Tax=Leersia perrieri TaxID=77586 RepID=A0A0D9WUD6_9ORYZ
MLQRRVFGATLDKPSKTFPSVTSECTRPCDLAITLSSSCLFSLSPFLLHLAALSLAEERELSELR